MNIILLHPKVMVEDFGLIPSMLDEEDPRPAREQFNDNYQHGGGWRPLPNLTLKGLILHYPGDPPMRPLALVRFHDETIVFYDHAIVAIIQAADGSFEACRMD